MAMVVKNLLRNSVWIRVFLGCFVVLDVILAYLKTARIAPSWMIFFEDDFFYYLKIAENLAHGQGSTFNGIVATNGYHPLWLLVLTGLSWISTNGHFILLSLVVLALVSALATFVLSAMLLKRAGANEWLASILSAYVAIYALHVFYCGMEIILAVPLMLLLAVVMERTAYWQRGFWQAFALGLIVAFTVLSRLDLILFIALLVFWTLLNPVVRAGLRSRTVAGIALGMSPLVLYLLVNHHFFGTLMPISGMAKELRFSHVPTAAPWRSIYAAHLNDWVALLPIEIATLLLPLVWKHLNATQRVVFPSMLLFQPVYVFLLSFLSDWQLWSWYRYPSRAALCASFCIFCIWPRTKQLMQGPIVAVIVFLAVCAQVRRADWTTTTGSIYAAAEDIRMFSLSHPGVYAMGDRSGMVGYEMSNPLVQTEGLVMDKPFLERIKREEELLPALSAYNVRYYVATQYNPQTRVSPASGCLHAAEPMQAGATSAHMRGELCHAPVARFAHDGYATAIYDLNLEPGMELSTR